MPTSQFYAAAKDVAWVNGSVPAGGTLASDGGDAWTWVTTNPASLSGSPAHQSNLAAGEHQHYFYGSTNTLAVGVGDKLYAYVYLDPANPPSEVMLQWNVNGSWEHRAYWGANSIGWGTDGTTSRQYMGTLPAAGGWVRLEVPASLVGLEGTTVNGMAFTLYGGRATWDQAGKVNAAANLAAAQFVGSDSTGQGNWKGTYGADGYSVAQDSSQLPAYAQLSSTGVNNYTWAGSTGDVRALQKAVATDRIAACWYSGSSFTLDLNLTDSRTHRVALYALDWDSYGPRSERVDIVDPATGTVLNSQTVSTFTGGKYLIWNLSGHVQIRITNLVNGSNAVVSGLFFG